MNKKTTYKNFGKFGDKLVNKIANTPNGILTRMFRKIIFETGLVRSLMHFIDRYRAEGGERVKTTIVKDITSSELTWKAFIFLLFEILKVKKINFKIEITWPNDNETAHELEISPIVIPKKNKKETRGRKPKYDQNAINQMLGVDDQKPTQEIEPKDILGETEENKQNEIVTNITKK